MSIVAGRGIVVTGAEGGIGRALAARLVAEGARVVGRGNKKAKADQLAFGTAGAHRARLAGVVDLPRAGE